MEKYPPGLLSRVLAIKGFPLLLLLCNSTPCICGFYFQPTILLLSRSKGDLRPERSYLNCDTGMWEGLGYYCYIFTLCRNQGLPFAGLKRDQLLNVNELLYIFWYIVGCQLRTVHIQHRS